jgi:hypothetical protein
MKKKISGWLIMALLILISPIMIVIYWIELLSNDKKDKE